MTRISHCEDKGNIDGGMKINSTKVKLFRCPRYCIGYFSVTVIGHHDHVTYTRRNLFEEGSSS